MARSCDWFLIYGPEKILVKSAKMKHTSPINAFFECIISTIFRSQIKKLTRATNLRGLTFARTDFANWSYFAKNT